MTNVWVTALNGQRVRYDRITGLVFLRIERQGWTVIGEEGPRRGHHLAALGRGPRAKNGAERLCNELPHVAASAPKGAVIVYEKRGYPKGEGQWRVLDPPTAARPTRNIPVTPPPDQLRPRRDRGTG